MKLIYAYKGYNLRDEVVTGQVEAKNKAEAMDSIRNIKRISECKLVGVQILNSLKAETLQLFFEQLSYLLTAGIALHKALLCLAESGDKSTKAIADKIYLDVVIGKAFSEAFRAVGGIYAVRFCPQLEAAEKGANLDQTLKDISIQLQKESKTRRTIITALIYPGIILVATVAIVSYLLADVVPSMATMLYELGGTLPAPTRMLIAISEVIAQWGFVVVLVLAVLGYLFIKLIKGKGKYTWDGFMIKVPLIGKILLNGEQINFYRSLYYMVNSGLAFVPALDFAVATVMNRRYQVDLEKAVDRVRIEGVDLATALTPIKYIDPIRLQAIRVGIESNNLQQTLRDTADSLDAYNEMLLERMQPVMEAVLLGVIGLLVGGIMMAMYMPMFTVLGSM